MKLTKLFKDIKTRVSDWVEKLLADRPVIKDTAWTKADIEEVNSKMSSYIKRNIPEDINILSKAAALCKAVQLMRYLETHPLFNSFIQLHVDDQLWIPQSRYNFTISDEYSVLELYVINITKLLEYSLIDDVYQLDIKYASEIRNKGFTVGVLNKDYLGNISFFTAFGNAVEGICLLEFGRI